MEPVLGEVVLPGCVSPFASSHWLTLFSKMRLFETKHLSAFRDAPEVVYPGVGSIRQVGPGAGNYTFIKVKEAGHSALRSCFACWMLYLLGSC